MAEGGSISRGRIFAALIALLGCACIPVARAEDLIDIYALAKANDPRYRAARYEFEAASYAEPQARAALLPLVTAELSHTDTRQRIISSANPVFALGQSQYPTENQTLSLTQPIFKLSAWRGYQQARSRVRQAAATFGAAEQDLMVRVATGYLSVLAAGDAVSFSIAERDAIRRQLDLVQQRFSSGIAAIANLHDARARSALKDADLVAAQNDFDDKVQALRELTGRVTPALKPLRDVIPLDQPSPSEMTHWVDTALQQNLLIEARRQAIEVAQQEISRQRASHVPALDMVANQNRRDTGGSLFGGGSNVETTDLMFRLSIPIFAGGLPTALTDEASKRYLVAVEELERDSRQLERQTRAAFQGVTGGIVRVQALAQGVTSSESARELKLEGFKAGIDTLLQVMDAERDVYAAKRDSARARYDFLLNRLRLKQAVGTLSEADLVTTNQLVQ